ncbi:hypothetical protein [Pedobacter puniceum]|uniref:Uncharacterized protein n=1 Tax=Pedobacter puniceum TaxID=2666136 RepID=A0A7K0FNB5_9SPHI|nr:hypothetical protein [Pedobacter puniceum]MRX47476.1 hypothetical protein [Pedobacter puniceum]
MTFLGNSIVEPKHKQPFMLNSALAVAASTELALAEPLEASGAAESFWLLFAETCKAFMKAKT